MSDIRKWLKIMESVPPVIATAPQKRTFDRDATVVIKPSAGGGVGRFMEYTTEGNAMVDIKGVARELSEDDFSLPERDLQNGNDWFHMSVSPDSEGTSNDQPEFRPGDMVKIADVYGTVIGPGFGVFVGYGTTGEDCIVLFDGKQIVVPVENVAAVLEQDAKDNFDEMDNDGNLSPMSFGSDNVKIEEPEMDNRDQFSKWMATVEEALSGASVVPMDMSAEPGVECGCGAWNCNTCFPDDSMGGEPDPSVVIAAVDVPDGETFGHMNIVGGHNNTPMDNKLGLAMNSIDAEEMELEEIGMMDDGDSDEIGMDEEEQHFVEKPASGKGVKLGDIVKKTEFRPAGGPDSPLTYGEENLGEEGWYNPSKDDLDMDMREPDWDADPLAVRDFHREMQGSPKSPAEVEQALDMISIIKNAQRSGETRSDRNYSEDELSKVGFDDLRGIYTDVTGRVFEDEGVVGDDAGLNYDPDMGTETDTMGVMETPVEDGNLLKDGIMENVDKDVAAMMASLKKYDMLKESVAPVLGMKTLNQKVVEDDGEKNPWEKLAKGKDEEDEGPKVGDTTKTSKGGTVTKTATGIKHTGTYGGEKAVKEEVTEEADPEVLEWMQRFSKLGNMKGYGR